MFPAASRLGSGVHVKLSLPSGARRVWLRVRLPFFAFAECSRGRRIARDACEACEAREAREAWQGLCPTQVCH
jgi:hypothetical protein